MNKGFSLIELMVVIAIVAILSAVAVPVYKKYITTSRLGSTMPIFESLKAGAMNYYNKNGSWPTSFTQIGVSGGSAFNSSLISSTGICQVSSGGCNLATGPGGNYTGEYGFYIIFFLSQLPALPSSSTIPLLVFTASPSSDGSTINWTCSINAGVGGAYYIPIDILPKGCKSPNLS